MRFITWLLGLLIIGGGAWYVWKQTTYPLTMDTSLNATTSDVSNLQQATSSGLSVGLSTSGSSDAELAQDMTQLDSQIQAAADANASVDEGMNDKPIAQ